MMTNGVATVGSDLIERVVVAEPRGVTKWPS